jgi:alcohol dehydrogenase, propanol-preferring
MKGVRFDQHGGDRRPAGGGANLARQDAKEFLALASKVPIRTEVLEFLLTCANEALSFLREGKIEGSAVLRIRD